MESSFIIKSIAIKDAKISGSKVRIPETYIVGENDIANLDR